MGQRKALYKGLRSKSLAQGQFTCPEQGKSRAGLWGGGPHWTLPHPRTVGNAEF